MFVIDHKIKVSLINHKQFCDYLRTLFLCDLTQTFLLLKCYVSECFVINCGKNGSCLSYHFPSMMSLVSCLLFHVSCLMYPVSWILSHASCLQSHISCLTSPVSCILAHASCLKSHFSCLTSHVSCLLAHVYRAVSPADLNDNDLADLAVSSSK